MDLHGTMPIMKLRKTLRRIKLSSEKEGCNYQVTEKLSFVKAKKKSFNLKKGDCLIHHCLMMHGSKKNLSNNSRRGFTIQLIGKNNSINKKQFALYKKSLEQQKRINLKIE